MKKSMQLFSIATMIVAATAGAALAGPTAQTFIPSTDIQGFATGRLSVYNFTRTSNKGGFPNYYDVGLSAGVLPWEKFQGEVGIDYLDGGQGGLGSDADKHPIYLNAKLGTPEDALFKYSPALAVGLWNLGTANTTKQNIVYGLAARTLPVVGRISAGGYHGSAAVLADENGHSANDGLLLSWDRTMTELTDKLWLGVDYMSGKNYNGSVNFGAAWSFTKNIQFLVGYDIYNDAHTGGKNTVTTQVFLNFP